MNRAFLIILVSMATGVVDCAASAPNLGFHGFTIPASITGASAQKDLEKAERFVSITWSNLCSNDTRQCQPRAKYIANVQLSKVGAAVGYVRVDHDTAPPDEYVRFAAFTCDTDDSCKLDYYY